MFWVRDHPRTDPEDQRGIDLEVSVFLVQIVLVDRHVDVLFFLGVDELDVAVGDEILELEVIVANRLDFRLGDAWFAVLDDQKRATSATCVGVDDHFAGTFFDRDVDHLADVADATLRGSVLRVRADRDGSPPATR